MSVPPQQNPYGQPEQSGNPPSHGEQPTQFGPQGQFNQQGGYPQQGGPAGGGQPGFPPQQPGYGPQQPYGAPGQFGPPGYNQQPGFGGQYGAPKSKSHLPWFLAGGGALVLVIIVVLVFVFSGGDDGAGGRTGSNSTAQEAAEGYVAALNSKDASAITSFTCQKDLDEAKKQEGKIDQGTLDQAKQGGEKFKNIKSTTTVVKVTQTDDTHAMVTLRTNRENIPQDLKKIVSAESETEVAFLLTDKGWQLCYSE